MNEDKLGKLYLDGEIICQEGRKADTMYVIQSGKVKITKLDESEPVELACLESGEIFGEMALFDMLPRSATATAVGETRILSVNRKKFFSSVNSDPTLVLKILEAMSGRIRKVSSDFSHLKKSRHDILTSFAGLDATCRRILETVNVIISSESSAILLLDENRKNLNLKASYGDNTKHNSQFFTDGKFPEQVLRTGEVKMVNNVSIGSHSESKSMEIMSHMCAPIVDQNGPFGVISLCRGSESTFSLEDLKLMHSISYFISISINNAKHICAFDDATDKFLSRSSIIDM